ncbi:MAG: hypothetical protein K1W21_18955, partial [Oscillospiraceae bacterium]
YEQSIPQLQAPFNSQLSALIVAANLQIHVKPQNEKSWKGFSKGKKGMTNQAGQRGIFANRLSRTIISG